MRPTGDSGDVHDARLTWIDPDDGGDARPVPRAELPDTSSWHPRWMDGWTPDGRDVPGGPRQGEIGTWVRRCVAGEERWVKRSSGRGFSGMTKNFE